MFPPLSDKTKTFAAIAAVLAVALCNVVFGTEWVSGPAPPRAAANAGVSEPPVMVTPPVQTASPAPSVATQPTNGNAAAPDNGASPANASAQMPEPVAPAATAPAETAQPSCDIAACAAAYHSFRESDCTWQPFEGPRRLCSKGTETSADNARADDNTPANERCHYRSCAEAYSSFNPSDCTYQPLDGPRRLCTK